MSYFFRLMAVVVICAAIFYVVRLAGRDLTEKPAIDLDTLRRTPQVSDRFVGPDTCRQCHSEIYEQWVRSGHSHTFADISDSSVIHQLDQARYHDPERNLAFVYKKTPAGLSVTIPEKFGEREFPLHFAFGSGMHAITFMSLFEDDSQETYGIEHRASWFAHSKSLETTPQPILPDPTNDNECFGRPFVGEELRKCFACHTTRFEFADAKLTNVIPQVTCESCHGAGQSHVSAANNGVFESLKFPSEFETEMAICERCHRSARDAPPNRLYAENTEIVRFQPVGLTQSRCFTESAGLKCSTCHDPHDHFAKTSRQSYLRSCLNCHDAEAENQVVCGVEPNGDCIRCHMPPVEVHPGVRFHDHWIRIRKDSAGSSDLMKPAHE